MSKKKFEKLSDLTPDPENANAGTARGLSAVEESLQQFGGGRSILAERDGVILAGNKTHERAIEAGFEPVFVHTNGKQLVVVVRDDLSLKDDPARARGLAYADNRAGELGLQWNPEQIKRDLEEGLQISPVFFTEAEIAGILNEKTTKAGHTDPDEAPEARDTTDIKPGDVFVLGIHRLMCGDSTVITDVEKLMDGKKARLLFTDAPYGVDYDGGTKKQTKLKGDDTTDLYAGMMPAVLAFTEDRAPLYFWYAGTKARAVFTAVEDAKIDVRNVIVWNKNLAQFGALSAQYHEKKELCLYAHRAGQSPFWYGPTNEVTVWDVERATKNDYHPTQKPVELARRAMRNSSQPGDLTLDLFGGSGSTMIAGEELGRPCYLMELKPKYAQVIVDRWEAFTQKKAVKL